MYTSAQGNTNIITEYMVTYIEPLFQYVHRTMPISLKYENRQFNVDAAVWGHVHQYERTFGIVKDGQCGQVDEDGTVHGML